MNTQADRRRWVRRGLRLLFWWRIRTRRYSEVWLDIGAHHGETTLAFAAARPRLLVYAFEPNPAAAAHIMGRLRNYVVLPFAVAETDGWAELTVTAYEQSSSIRELRPKGVDGWVGRDGLVVVDKVQVPTIRLDSFLERFGVSRVDFMKVDAQGGDLAVVQSAGSRLADIARIDLEVTTVDEPVYAGSATRQDVLDYMTAQGFQLVEAQQQSYGQEENLTFVAAGR